MKPILKRHSRTALLSAGILMASGHTVAYNLHSENGTELNLDVEIMVGLFNSEENYQGKSGDGSDWQEAYFKAGLSGSQAVGEQNDSLYGAVNVVSSGTFGDGDAAGFTSGNERKTELEDVYVGWRSGDLLPVLGENGVDVSFGRQNISIGDGFLLNGDALNLGDTFGDLANRGGGYWLAPRKAFDETFMLKLGGTEGLRSDLFWFKSDNSGQANVEMAGVNLEYVTEQGTFGAMYLKGIDQDDVLGLGYDRDGQKTFSLRYQGNAGVENLFLNAEVVSQESGSGVDSNAWTAEAGWTFADVPWSPVVNYRYTTYDDTFDSLFFGFSRGYGTWYQGEIAANYNGPFGSDSDIHHLGLKVTPSETLALGALFFDFNGSTAGGTDGQELDLYAEWVVNDHLILSPLVGFYSPDSDNVTQNTQSDNTYFQLLAIVPF